jgi:hypothetical protein
MMRQTSADDLPHIYRFHFERTFMRKTVALVAVLPLALFACGGPTKYDQAQFSDTAAIHKQAGGYWKRDGFWRGLPQTVNKVAITEFSIEYVTQNKSKSGASALSILGAAEMMGMGKRKRVFTPEFKAQFPAVMYQGFVAALKEEGIDAVPMETITAHPAFKDLSGAKPGKSFGAADRVSSAKIEIFPAPGLPVVDDGWFKGVGNAKAEAALVAETGAQAGLRVRIRVALDDDGRAVLDGGSTIRAIYDPQKTTSGFNKDTLYYMKGAGVALSKAAMRDDVPVITSKEFKAFQGDVYTIDGPKFQESILRMYPAYARMAAATLRKG